MTHPFAKSEPTEPIAHFQAVTKQYLDVMFDGGGRSSVGLQYHTW